MNDFILNWSVNVMIQFTCLAACGLATSALLRRSPAARSGVLVCILMLTLMLLPLTAAMLASELSFVPVVFHGDATRNASNPTGSELFVEQRLPGSGRRDHRPARAEDIDGLLTEGGESRTLARHLSPLDATRFDSASRGSWEPSGGAVSDASNGLLAAGTKDGQAVTGANGTTAMTVVRIVATWIGWVWLVGAVLLVGRVAVGWWRVGQLLRSSERFPSEPLEHLLPRIASELNRERLPVVVVSDRVSGPISAGIVRPRIVLPKFLCGRISSEQLHDVLVHEMAHIVRRDQITVLLQNVARAVYWPHPLVRWLNQALAQSREEVCDNYVLKSSSAPSYSLTLLTLAEMISPPGAVPGAVGLFTSKWKLEDRVMGLLDERRSRMLTLTAATKLLFAAITVSLAALAAVGTIRIAGAQQSHSQETKGARQTSTTAELKEDRATVAPDPAGRAASPTLRGHGEDTEMRLQVSVVDVDGSPTSDFDASVNVKTPFGREAMNVSVKENQFEAWIPVGGNDWFFVEVSAVSKDGRRRATQGIENWKLRQAAVDDVRLQFDNADRTVTVTVMKEGRLLADAHVVADISLGSPMRGKTNHNGEATFSLLAGERLNQLTAWTDDYWIGGYQFSRKPRRDPMGSEFEIQLEDCRTQVVRFLREEDDAPVGDVAFNLTLGTGQPDYNFVAVPGSFPHVRLKTDARGEAVCHWFPNWDQHGAYVEIVDPHWAKAWTELKTEEDGALVMKLKPRVDRKPLIGQVTSGSHDVGGLLLQIRTFQAEEEGYSDHVYAFTDENGVFSADCIPGSTYCVCVNDAHLVSNTIDLIPYEPVTGQSNRAELIVSEGEPITVRVTSGPNHRPMADTWVHFREIHDYSWYENGVQRGGAGGRAWGRYTDKNGTATARANAGSEIEVSVNAGNWRSDRRTIVVGKDEVTTVEFHREIDVQRAVTGRLITPRGLNVDLARAEIIHGSIDGETDEVESLVADGEGRFEFETRAIQLGIFVYTADRKAAGVFKPETLDRPLEVRLSPTADLQGQLLGSGDEPLANHAVRVTPMIRGKADRDTSFRTGFLTKTFETTTDSQGNYTLKDLPTGIDMTLRADPIDGSGDEVRLDTFFLQQGEERPRLISRLGPNHVVDNRTLADRYAGVLRDANLNDFHVLVLICDASSDDFVGRYLMDHRRTKEAMSFMNLRIRETDFTDDGARDFAELHNWPQPRRGKVFMVALDGGGSELARATLDTQDDGAQAEAAEFLTRHAPEQADAKRKWDAAFAEAARTGRKVWARIGQRYCGPCFRLSRWLDDNREPLERDYVLLKIDDVRDKYGVEIANRIVSKPGYGVPFHAIFDVQENLLIDSEGPTGNIGHPSSFEGREHVRRMLSETRTSLTDADIDGIVSTLE